ncbi:MAG: hypothetical protein MUP58_01450 [Candidatus Nanohaloarchaeota archaeon QJJ-9]|nr:hypothetical protein [Candidatus Nanohaloarchaeota archaeon QJJ-9]
MVKRKKQTTEKHECPNCHKEALIREAAGVWKCSSCGKSVAGGSYEPDTGAEDLIEKAIREGTEELEEAKEKIDVE